MYARGYAMGAEHRAKGGEKLTYSHAFLNISRTNIAHQ
jgi:hypothetical protein